MEEINNSLAELQKRKQALREEIKAQEKILKFENVKESLSVMTNGFTDQFLKEKNTPTHEHPEHKSLKLDTSIFQNTLFNNAVKLGIATSVSKYARKNIESNDWKKNLLGLAIVYITPVLINKGIEWLEERQEK
ncbi:hypothetical protein [Elizabethkingia sp. JS20170427COW]|uniref:hypothetical protein n=1 Tax=Elizabethkingia sp. JS20170427COW TaxID=2583851 RepID=UPI001110BB59|nr:hypothetical protein [Elizabethkingia sp. JS20170427COW]QCX52561.1 hypothetical protein FGE20_01760 [Elizabethkingia sp. JS20170427COW]